MLRRLGTVFKPDTRGDPDIPPPLRLITHRTLSCSVAVYWTFLTGVVGGEQNSGPLTKGNIVAKYLVLYKP